MSDSILDNVKAELEARFSPETEANDAEAMPHDAEPESKIEAAAGETGKADATGNDDPPIVESASQGKPAATDWVDDEVKALAAMAGAETSEFTDRADFNRAMRLLARGTASRAAQAAQPPAKEAPAPTQQTTPAETTETKPGKLADKFKPGDYAEEVVELAKMVDRLEEREAAREAALATQQQTHAQAEHQRVMREAHSALDSLDAERYGTLFDDKGNEKPLAQEAVARRFEVLKMADVLATSAQQAGRPLPPLKVLLKHADDAVYAAENVKREIAKADKARADQIRARAGLRMGGGNRPAAPKQTTGPLSQNPEFLGKVRDIVRAEA